MSFPAPLHAATVLKCSRNLAWQLLNSTLGTTKCQVDCGSICAIWRGFSQGADRRNQGRPELCDQARSLHTANLHSSMVANHRGLSKERGLGAAFNRPRR